MLFKALFIASILLPATSLADLSDNEYYTEILERFELEAAGENADAQVATAVAYVNLGRKQEAAKLLRSASNAKHGKATLLLGALLLDQPQLQSRDFEAHDMLLAAREMGQHDAHLLLGQLYDQTTEYPFSHQVFKSKLAAFKSYEVAAALDEPLAHFALARAYMEGRIVERSLQNSQQHLESAAKLNHGPAQYLNALMYSGVEDRPANMEQAIYWMCRSAASGFLQAQVFVRDGGYCKPKQASLATKHVSPQKNRKVSMPDKTNTSGSKTADYFSIFLSGFFQALGQVAVYELTGVSPYGVSSLTDSDLEAIASVARNEARRAARHQIRMQQIYRNVRTPMPIGTSHNPPRLRTGVYQ